MSIRESRNEKKWKIFRYKEILRKLNLAEDLDANDAELLEGAIRTKIIKLRKQMKQLKNL